MNKCKKLTEEHKRKIGEANKISLKGKHCSPRTEFKKGQKPVFTGRGLPQIREKNHYRWKGGTRQTARRLAKRYGYDMNRCMICGDIGKTVVHHIDTNEWNNDKTNISVVCYSCHSAFHQNGLETRFKKVEK